MEARKEVWRNVQIAKEEGLKSMSNKLGWVWCSRSRQCAQTAMDKVNRLILKTGARTVMDAKL